MRHFTWTTTTGCCLLPTWQTGLSAWQTRCRHLRVRSSWVTFKHYMARRSEVTQELEHWTNAVYDMALQTNDSSCGVLALMTAEAVIHSVLLSVVNPSAVSSYRKYLKTRLLLNSRLYDVDADAVCDMPLCVQPTSARIVWTQCDQCDRWLHNKCSDRLMMAARSKKGFVCELCLL